jgi:two-component system NtrC family sensor kinase
MKRVLIVDDAPATLKLLKKHLTSSGYEVAGTAADGRQAVAQAEALLPDVVLMDIVMPGRPDGIDAGALIRSKLDIPVIFVTGYEDDELIGRAAHVGADGYLKKPVKVGQLKAAIEIALDRKASAREFKDFFCDLIENTNDLVYVMDGEGNVRYINNRVSEKLGYSYQDIVGKTFADFVNPSSFKFAADIFRRQLNGEDIGAFELELVDRNGDVKIIETREQLKWQGGRVVEVRGIGRDVTERKRAEVELRSQTAFMQTIIDSIPSPIFYKDAEGRYLGCNAAFAHYLGRTKDEIVGKTVYDISPKELADVYYKKDRELLGNPGVQSYETRVSVADGTIHDAVFNKATFHDASGALGGIVGIVMDVTDLRSIEAALRESEEKFRSMVESINDVVLTLGADGTITYISPAVHAMLGYYPDEAIGRNFGQFIHPDDLPGLIASFERSLKGIIEEAEFRIISKDGSPRYVRSLTNTVIQDGVVIGLTGVLTDIDRRKKVEEALKESEEKYREIFDSAIEGIYQTTPEGRFISVNPSFARILGYDTARELMSATTDIERQIYVDPHLRGKIKGLLAERGEVHNFEGQAYRRDGSITWVSLDATSVTDESGAIVRYQGFMQDINERKMGEEALRQSEEKFRSLFETTRDVVYISTAEGRFLDVNSAAEETLGYSRRELLAINVKDLYKDPKERERFKLAVAEKGFVKDHELQMKKKDGAVIDCLITATVRRSPEGDIIGYQGIIRDVTEWLRLRRQLIQTEKLSSLGGMISGVAHELNNPLTSIIGNAQLLMRKEIPPDFRNKLEVIQRESVRCTKIVGGLLSFAREHKPERRMIDVNTVLTESLKLREYDLKVNNIQVDTKLADDLPETSADPYQLQQVFINLINNSHDALREKGGTLSIRSSFKDDFIRVVFADDGPGIEPGNLNRIFDPFFTTKDIGKGTGLGLSIAYGIIHEHGGTIDAESRPGKGVTFRVAIPTATSPRDEDGQGGVGGGPFARSGTVLVVEDEAPLREMIIEALTDGGYLSEGARDGEHALRLIKKRTYDAVISDMKIPGIGGKELYTYIQKQRPTLADRMIFITGDVLSRDTLHFLKITGNKFLEKPFDIDNLLHHVGEIIARGQDPQSKQ